MTDGGRAEGWADNRHLDGDELTELALGHVDGPARAHMAAHLLTCTGCRHEYDALVATIEEVLPAVPAVQPPLGFDERVIDRIRPRRRRRWRRWVAGAAAAALVAVGALGVWWAADGTGDEDIEAAVLTRDDGGEVGSVLLSEVDGDRMMVVAVVDPPPDVSYTCVARLADGTVVESHPWEPGAGAWIVPLPAAGDVTDVDLVVTGTDHVWSSASFT